MPDINGIPQPVALLGGTGRSGPGLALHLARAGIDIVIGSRDAARAQATAAEVTARLGVATAGTITGTDNAEAARRCGLAVVTVPFDAVEGLVPAVREHLAGKVVVSTVVPVTFAGGAAAHIDVPAGSAAAWIADLLPASRVTAALHTVSSRDLEKLDSLDADSVITGDDEEALAATVALVGSLPGLRPVVAGPLRYGRYSEHLTVLILAINRRHKVNAGIRIAHL